MAKPQNKTAQAIQPAPKNLGFLLILSFVLFVIAFSGIAGGILVGFLKAVAACALIVYLIIRIFGAEMA